MDLHSLISKHNRNHTVVWQCVEPLWQIYKIVTRSINREQTNTGRFKFAYYSNLLVKQKQYNVS